MVSKTPQILLLYLIWQLLVIQSCYAAYDNVYSMYKKHKQEAENKEKEKVTCDKMLTEALLQANEDIDKLEKRNVVFQQLVDDQIEKLNELPPLKILITDQKKLLRRRGMKINALKSKIYDYKTKYHRHHSLLKVFMKGAIRSNRHIQNLNFKLLEQNHSFQIAMTLTKKQYADSLMKKYSEMESLMSQFNKTHTDIVREMENNFDTLKANIIQNYENVLNKTMLEHDSQLTEMSSSMAEMKSSYESRISVREANYTATVANMQSSYTQNVQDLMSKHHNTVSSIKSDHESQVNHLNNKYQKQIRETETSHSNQIQSLQSSHESQVKQLQTSYDSQIQNINLNHEQKTSKKIRLHAKEVSDLRIKLADVLQKLKGAEMTLKGAYQTLDDKDRLIQFLTSELDHFKTLHETQTYCNSTRIKLDMEDAANAFLLATQAQAKSLRLRLTIYVSSKLHDIDSSLSQYELYVRSKLAVERFSQSYSAWYERMKLNPTLTKVIDALQLAVKKLKEFLVLYYRKVNHWINVENLRYLKNQTLENVILPIIDNSRVLVNGGCKLYKDFDKSLSKKYNGVLLKAQDFYDEKTAYYTSVDYKLGIYAIYSLPFFMFCILIWMISIIFTLCGMMIEFRQKMKEENKEVSISTTEGGNSAAANDNNGDEVPDAVCSNDDVASDEIHNAQ